MQARRKGMPPRLFTFEEATTLLPVVRQLLTEIQAGREEVAQASARLDELLGLTGGNGHLTGQVEAAREVAQEAAAKATAEIKTNEGKLVDFFKQKGLTVTEVNKDEFRDTVLKNVSFESFDYRKADWERIQAVK